MTHPVILTFDLEDWYQLVGRQLGFAPTARERGRLRSQVRRILDTLTERGTKATFFVLGMTAADAPEVVKEVADAGHEIASHGFGHEPVRSLGVEAFTRDVDRAIAAIESATGRRPHGYRAPAFSIDEAAFWAFDVLVDRGFTYDSSIFPFRGRRYGIAGFPPGIGEVHGPGGRALVELPLAVLDLGPVRLPVAGGGYWRAIPWPLLSRAVRAVAAKRPPVLYFHPAEFDRRLLAPSDLSRPRVLAAVAQQNLGRGGVPGKLAALLATHNCVSVEQFLAARPEA